MRACPPRNFIASEIPLFAACRSQSLFPLPNRPSSHFAHPEFRNGWCVIPLLALPQGGEYARFQFVHTCNVLIKYSSCRLRRRRARILLLPFPLFQEGRFAFFNVSFVAGRIDERVRPACFHLFVLRFQ